MRPETILEKLERFEIKRKKKIKPQYVELVFYTRDTAEWTAFLSQLLGKPIKSKWRKPSGNDRKLTRKFGGIRAGQTLFKKTFKDYTILAMIWPWKDKTHSTLKIPMLSHTNEKTRSQTPSAPPPEN